jgi:hypothetical protein
LPAFFAAAQSEQDHVRAQHRCAPCPHDVTRQLLFDVSAVANFLAAIPVLCRRQLTPETFSSSLPSMTLRNYPRRICKRFLHQIGVHHISGEE